MHRPKWPTRFYFFPQIENNYLIFISTRRFRAFPSSESFGEIGFLLPNP